MKSKANKQFQSESVSLFDKKYKGTHFAGSEDLDMVDAKDVVAKAIGTEPDFAMLFTYMFRRFGAPIMPNDDYKKLCRYVITTPMENIFLSVHPSASNFNFSFVYPARTMQNIVWGNHAEVKKWCIRMRVWAKKEHKINLFENFGGFLSIYNKRDKKHGAFMTPRNRKLFIREINKWLFTSYPQWAGEDTELPQEETKKVFGEFLEYKGKEIKKYTALYEKVEKKPSMKSKEGIKLQKDIIKAISATAKDLLRPTYIRDVYFNILKNNCDFNGSTDKKYKDSTVEYFDYSGQAQVLRNSIQKADNKKPKI